MKPLLQHASRSLIASSTSIASPSRALGSFVSRTPLICVRCQHRAAPTALRRGDRTRLNCSVPEGWSKRTIWSSKRCLEESNQHANQSKPALRSEVTTPESLSSLQGQEGLQDGPDAALESRGEENKTPQSVKTVPGGLSAIEAQQRLKEERTAAPVKDHVADNIARVPDEHLPSHRERQRWDLSKRFSEAMDELLPKLAVVTQKVNTYTGTDYSGVEALRREIKEQENLVKARRAAIDSAKQALDTALAHQTSSQKEVVALLERKHSWSAGDLERYMALIRSEHINDQAVREGKEAVANAEDALEEARSQLEKRERAQYHEEQIWSDTIRRNSTWVTFGLMGFNIFLLLLSLLILEPWRRRRMVREIKNVLAAQKAAMEAAPVAVNAVVPVMVEQDGAPTEEAIDSTVEPETALAQISTAASAVPDLEESPTVEMDETILARPSSAHDAVPESTVAPALDPAYPGITPLSTDAAEVSPPESINIAEEALERHGIRGRLEVWQEKVTAVAQDVISDRTISIRRIDYTTAILQGAAAGAVIAAAAIAMLRPS